MTRPSTARRRIALGLPTSSLPSGVTVAALTPKPVAISDCAASCTTWLRVFRRLTSERSKCRTSIRNSKSAGSRRRRACSSSSSPVWSPWRTTSSCPDRELEASTTCSPSSWGKANPALCCLAWSFMGSLPPSLTSLLDRRRGLVGEGVGICLAHVGRLALEAGDEVLLDLQHVLWATGRHLAVRAEDLQLVLQRLNVERLVARVV